MVRFSLVVLVPLAVGLAVPACGPGLGRAEPELAGLATLTLVVLVWARGRAAELLEAAASALFLSATAVLVAVWICSVRWRRRGCPGTRA